MSMFNQMIQGGNANSDYPSATKSSYAIGVKPRTFRETIQDQMAHHKSKIDGLQSVLDSLSPEVEKFVEAMQKLG